VVVLHTPNVAQTIKGVEFSKFGQHDVPDRYPIHFDNCGDISPEYFAMHRNVSHRIDKPLPSTECKFEHVSSSSFQFESVKSFDKGNSKL
jgi:hypothetical protein